MFGGKFCGKANRCPKMCPGDAASGGRQRGGTGVATVVASNEENTVGSMDFHAGQRQSTTLSPRLQHAVRLLQMSSMDFAAVLRETMDRNPFLDVDESQIDGAADGASSLAQAPGSADDADEGWAIEPAVNAAPADEREAGGIHDADARSHDDDAPSPAPDGADAPDDSDRDLWQADGIGTTRRNDDGEWSAIDMTASETSLTAHLHGQLNLLPLAPRDGLLARALVECLDDDGYLRMPPAELAQVVSLDPPASAAEIQIALSRVQALDPAGVAARSVAECLQLQLPAIECADTREIAERIISHHLPALAARDTAGLARALGMEPARIDAVCQRIRRLDPRPGWRFGSSHVAYVVPDVITRRVHGEWQVHLNPAVVPRVRLNHVYAELFRRHRAAQDGALASHLQEARWTLRNVEQRFATILDVAQAIVRRQRHFLEYGAMAMKPLGLREIADELGMHESTVSRVTNNKYIATPAGVLELKYFFSRAMVSASGRACSGTAIRGLIRDIIASENEEQPLSDAEITRLLAQQGLVVARRTVTKYRQMLRIDAVDRRRRAAVCA
jgi:RNA polymerase sigma-54 factor